MVSSGLVRTVFFRSGLREQVRGEIESEQRRERKARAKLKKQLGQLQQSGTGAEKRLRHLEHRYERLLEKHSAATELLGRQREQFAQLEGQVRSLVRTRLEEVVSILYADFRFSCGTFTHPINRRALIFTGSARGTPPEWVAPCG